VENGKRTMQNSKLKKLKKILKELKSVVVAYSGGVDSTFLLKMATTVLGKENVLAVSAKSETYPSREAREARKIAAKLKAHYKVINTSELNIKNFSKNPVNRCYFCKKELFQKLKKTAEKNKYNAVVDGTNHDDLSDWRAGRRAAKELGVRSPLAEAKFTKNDIRFLSNKLMLPTAKKPSFACLASRFPYNHTITKKKLSIVDKAENFLRDLGFGQVRVRFYDQLARIEVGADKIKKLVNLRQTILKEFKKLGFIYVTIDLEGYRTGSMNEEVFHV